MAGRKEMAAGMAFEEAMERLEAIVGEMESERLPLEKLIAGYEEGTRLLKVCQDRIADAQKRIELIARAAGAGDIALKEFDPDAGEAGKDEEPGEDEEEEEDEVRLL